MQARYNIVYFCESFLYWALIGHADETGRVLGNEVVIIFRHPVRLDTAQKVTLFFADTKAVVIFVDKWTTWRYLKNRTTKCYHKLRGNCRKDSSLQPVKWQRGRA